MGGCFTPFLNLKAIVSLSKTCKSFYQLLNHPPVWQDLLTRFFTQPRLEYPMEFQQAPKLLFRTLEAERRLKESQETYMKVAHWKSEGYWH
ncbi:MAG: F-box protein [Candidatus Berkiella sp.]